MHARPGRRRSLSLILVPMLVALLAIVLPTTAQAADGVQGGSTREAAVPLPVSDLDQAFTGSNTGQTGQAGTTGTWNNIAWYSWTPAQDVRVFIRATSLSPARWDNTLEVWSGGSRVGQNDDFYSLDAGLVVELFAGVRYEIGLGGFQGTSRGTATVTFSTRVPTPPLSVATTPGDSSGTVSWAAPADLAGGVTRYTVLCTPEGGAEAECASLTGTPPATSVTVPSLTNGTSYSVRVIASNVIGPSEPSASASFVPRATSATAITTTPASPASGEPFDVTVRVTAGGAPVATGTVDVTVGGTVVTGMPLSDGQAVLRGLTRTAGSYALGAAYSGTPTVVESATSAGLTVVRRSQTVDLEALPGGLVYDGAPVTVQATASSGLPVSITADGACALSAGKLHLVDVGTCTVTATQAGDSETAPASASQQVAVGTRPQTISFAPLPTLVYGATTTPAASSSVGLPVTITATGACTATDGTVTATDVGTCTVTATQVGDTRTAAATAVVRTAVVGKQSQTITFSALPSLVFGQGPVEVSATSDRGLPVTLTAEGSCLVADGALVAVGSGECALTAQQEGDRVTEAATASRTVIVTGPPTALDAAFDATVGDEAQGARVSATGTGLLPGSELVLEVHSTPQVIGTTTVGADGTATVFGNLPMLEAGPHRLIAVGTALDGERAEFVIPFTVSADGTLVRVADEVLPEAAAAAPALARTGAELGDAAALAAFWVLAGAAILLLRRRFSPPGAAAASS